MLSSNNWVELEQGQNVKDSHVVRLENWAGAILQGTWYALYAKELRFYSVGNEGHW